jgi:hypothetical protein
MLRLLWENKELDRKRGILPEVEKKEGCHLRDDIQSSSFVRMMGKVACA